jgi:hypothetical protein
MHALSVRRRLAHPGMVTLAMTRPEPKMRVAREKGLLRSEVMRTLRDDCAEIGARGRKA